MGRSRWLLRTAGASDFEVMALVQPHDFGGERDPARQAVIRMLSGESASLFSVNAIPPRHFFGLDLRRSEGAVPPFDGPPYAREQSSAEALALDAMSARKAAGMSTSVHALSP